MWPFCQQFRLNSTVWCLQPAGSDKVRHAATLKQRWETQPKCCVLMSRRVGASRCAAHRRNPTQKPQKSPNVHKPLLETPTAARTLKQSSKEVVFFYFYFIFLPERVIKGRHTKWGGGGGGWAPLMGAVCVLPLTEWDEEKINRKEKYNQIKTKRLKKIHSKYKKTNEGEGLFFLFWVMRKHNLHTALTFCSPTRVSCVEEKGKKNNLSQHRSARRQTRDEIGDWIICSWTANKSEQA